MFMRLIYLVIAAVAASSSIAYGDNNFIVYCSGSRDHVTFVHALYLESAPGTFRVESQYDDHDTHTAYNEQLLMSFQCKSGNYKFWKGNTIFGFYQPGWDSNSLSWRDTKGYSGVAFPDYTSYSELRCSVSANFSLLYQQCQ
jgi:hypothetical protein